MFAVYTFHSAGEEMLVDVEDVLFDPDALPVELEEVGVDVVVALGRLVEVDAANEVDVESEENVDDVACTSTGWRLTRESA